MNFLRLSGERARARLPALAELRMRVFREYPYLYEGSQEEERSYLEAYFQSDRSLVLLVETDTGKVVGASTALPLSEADEAFRLPFGAAGIDPNITYYFGESVVLPEFRGQGVGARFLSERERRARELGNFEYCAFLSVMRDEGEVPADYHAPDSLWRRHGFARRSDIVARFPWREIGQREQSIHRMVGWIKPVHS